MTTLNIFLCLLLCKIFQSTVCDETGKEAEKNWLTDLKGNVEKIKAYLNNPKGRAYRGMAFNTDTCGPRLAGSEGLECSINLVKLDAINRSMVVKEENVTVTNWREISSTANFISNFRNKSLSIVAYGPSVPTGKNLTAKILLVTSFDELDKRKDEANGRIVVYNQRWKDYATNIQYRNDGASKAAEYGAVASLTRSVTPYRFNNLITGPVNYTSDKKIPAAAITAEDAAFIGRILARDPNATIELDIKTEIGQDKTSKNTIFEIPGTELTNEILMSGTHIDSWHVADGILNNAIGCNVLYEAMRVIKILDLKPKRTLRLAFWTAGEQNAKGERQFFDEQKKNKDEKIKFIMKSERDVFDISGLIIQNGETFHGRVQEIFDAFFKDLKVIPYSNTTARDSTVRWVSDESIPRFEFKTDLRRYYGFYNSGGDTLDKVGPEESDEAITIWATILYLLASKDTLE